MRVSAPDLQLARRTRARIRAGADVAVILDVTIAAADDFRSARKSMCIADEDLTVHYGRRRRM